MINQSKSGNSQVVGQTAGSRPNPDESLNHGLGNVAGCSTTVNGHDVRVVDGHNHLPPSADSVLTQSAPLERVSVNDMSAQPGLNDGQKLLKRCLEFSQSQRGCLRAVASLIINLIPNGDLADFAKVIGVNDRIIRQLKSKQEEEYIDGFRALQTKIISRLISEKENFIRELSKLVKDSEFFTKLILHAKNDDALRFLIIPEDFKSYVTIPDGICKTYLPITVNYTLQKAQQQAKVTSELVTSIATCQVFFDCTKAQQYRARAMATTVKLSPDHHQNVSIVLEKADKSDDSLNRSVIFDHTLKKDVPEDVYKFLDHGEPCDKTKRLCDYLLSMATAKNLLSSATAHLSYKPTSVSCNNTGDQCCMSLFACEKNQFILRVQFETDRFFHVDGLYHEDSDETTKKEGHAFLNCSIRFARFDKGEIWKINNVCVDYSDDINSCIQKPQSVTIDGLKGIDFGEGRVDSYR